jgi:ABC-2 type transport system ATP-binding protein
VTGGRRPRRIPGLAGDEVPSVPSAAVSAPATSAVEVDELTIRYGDLTAVDRLSFTAERGAITALLGPNGAGKTSTVEALEGFRSPDEGQVRVLGLDPRRQRPELTARVGVMLQQGGVATGLRPPEVLRQYAGFYPDPADPLELLARVGLAERATTPWRRLSGGEQQRLSLALALVGRPELVFLDEPTAGVDVAGRQLIRRVIAELRERGVTVVLTTHDLDEAERLADRVLIVDRGRLVAAGTPAELVRGAGGDEIRFGAPPRLDVVALGRRLDAAVREAAPGEYVVSTAPTPAAVAALTSWLAEHDLALADLRAGRQRLEDVFLRLTEPSGDGGGAR